MRNTRFAENFKMAGSFSKTPGSRRGLGVFVLGALLSLGALVGAAEPTVVDVFTSGAEGYHTYRIPALIVSPKGTLLLFCEGRKTGRGDHGDLDMVLKRSTDGGETWGPLQLVYEEGGTQKITIGNPCPVVDQSTGTIWLPLNRDNNDCLITHSSDDGRTWSKPRLITKDVKRADWGWYAMGPGNAIQLTRGEHKGRMLIPCDHRVNGKTSLRLGGRSHVIYSDDGGKTWQLGGATGWGMNECAVVELPDGKLLLNSRSYLGKGRRGISTSSDGGLTWSKVTSHEQLIESVCQASMIRYSWAEQGGKSRLLFSNPATTKGRHHMTVRMSYDEGRTWPVNKLVYAGSAAYSCLTVLPDKQIGMVYERDNYKKIVFTRFTLDWLTDGKDKVREAE